MNDLLRATISLICLSTAGSALAVETNRSTSFAVGALVVDTCRLDDRRSTANDKVGSACLPGGEAIAPPPQPIVTVRRNASGVVVAMNIEF